MRIIKRVSIDRIFSKVYNDYGLEDIDESTIVEWVGDVLSHLEVEKAYTEKVSFLEIKNHQAELPSHIISILKVARNMKFNPKTCCTQEDLEDLGCGTPIIENCELSPCLENLPLISCCDRYTEFPCGQVHRKPNFNFNYDYYSWISSDMYTSQFKTIRGSHDAFKTGLICEIDKDKNSRVYNTSIDEYQLVDGRYIRVNFKDGQLAIAYLSQAVDTETGYPLIPDDISVISAITNYVLFMYCRKMHIAGRPGMKEKYKEAEADYQWYLSQAKNKLYFPHGEDEFQKLTNQRFAFIPNIYKRDRGIGSSLTRFAQDDINYINRHNG